MKKCLLFLLMSFVCSKAIIGQTTKTFTKADYEGVCVFDEDVFVDHMDRIFGDRQYSKKKDPYVIYDGLLCAKLLGKWGFLDNTGKEIIPFDYFDAKPFSEGIAAIIKPTGKHTGDWVYINKLGNHIINTNYDEVESFSEGLAVVNNKGKYGYINKEGKLVIPFKYDDARSFSEGLAVVKLNNKYGYIDKVGNEIIPCKYGYAEDFSDGVAAVSNDVKYNGFINKQGKVIIPLDSYTSNWGVDGRNTFINGHAFVIPKNEYSKIIIDKNGNKKDEVSDAAGFIDGMYGFYDNNYYGVKNISGNTIIRPAYNHIWDYNDGFFSVEKDGKIGVIDKHGIIKVPFRYKWVDEVHEGIAAVQKEEKGKYAFVNIQGKEITPFVFDDVLYFSGGIAAVKINGKVGFVDKNGAPLKIDFSGSTCYKMGNSIEAKFDQNNPSTNKYLDEAFKWFIKGANKSDKYSCFEVGIYNIFGWGKVPQNYIEGAKWLEKTISLKGETNGKEYLYLGTIYKDGGFGLTKNVDKAIKYFTDGAQIKKNASCYNELAYIYANKKNYNLALNYIDKAIQISSSNIDKANFYDSKGEIYLMMGKDDEALKMWNKVMTLNPKYLNDYPQGTELYKKLKAKGKI